MFVRMAISLTLSLFPGAAFAEWQPQTAAATSNPSKGMASQAASGVVPASLEQHLNSTDADVQSIRRTDIEVLIREGNKHMREGDILGARQLYREAFTSGDTAAALAMGRSYDPIYFNKITERNAEPDPAKAFEWYRRAMAAGAIQTSTVRIEDLKQFLGK